MVPSKNTTMPVTGRSRYTLGSRGPFSRWCLGPNMLAGSYLYSMTHLRYLKTPGASLTGNGGASSGKFCRQTEAIESTVGQPCTSRIWRNRPIKSSISPGTPRAATPRGMKTNCARPATTHAVPISLRTSPDTRRFGEGSSLTALDPLDNLPGAGPKRAQGIPMCHDQSDPFGCMPVPSNRR